VGMTCYMPTGAQKARKYQRMKVYKLTRALQHLQQCKPLCHINLRSQPLGPSQHMQQRLLTLPEAA
jgi:hypothetical protein